MYNNRRAAFDMSLSTLLNKEDKDIIVDDKEDKEKLVESQPENETQKYINQLNNSINKLIKRDSTEKIYQDWKFINFQEFELISEWNNQSKDWDNYKNFKALYSRMNDYKDEWEHYENLKENKLALLNSLKTSTSKSGTTSKKSRKQKSTTEKVNVGTLANGDDNNGAEVNGVDDIDSTLNDGDNVNEDNQDGDESLVMDQDDEEVDENDDGKENEEDQPNGEMIPLDQDDTGENFEDDEEEDDEFQPDEEKKKALKNSKLVTIHSDKPRIVRELVKMSNKNKNPKIKKRRFTNALVTDYSPHSSSLTMKITLKQYHVKKLKKLINELKRKKEKELELANSLTDKLNNLDPANKKRKLNDTDDLDAETAKKKITCSGGNQSNVNSHNLPTYGMKMSAKEARAIQRHYDNTYITIWKDMARKDSNKMSRLVQQIQSIRSTNFKKTSSLCAREARKWQSRNFKQVKDFQTRARRGIREMSNFWKKNEREEREIRKKAEKVALEQAKKEEEEAETKRQAKKLNFLLTQTELYSHFIGRKIKTSEIEGTTNNASENGDVDLESTAANKSEFRDIDFDNEDDDQLRQRAAQNASNVLAQTRAQAKAFDSEEQKQEEEDDELNFQNPTSLGEITLEQPKLLACTLKEYQLKGLNWLANLYDQGINGILADEMGLGKTVQSISVLAHLAERNNIWGPFLVVTPASTLHNWVNEISKFVPEFKILPYWGNANDRKILRKFWDRRNVRYGKNAPFHVMITSYQMVVSDVNYLQKMKWQYMILDEAQAIKSSQSSRWRNLLSFHCRNRLLLTGTPIQNNMQELWALLHFIMPSLFDSHDEFSEWFSKDIESHAEGNGSLNQQQLRRLHMILKPFMLRRIKKNVQTELGDKIEIDVMCDLTQRQAKLYKVLRSQVSSSYDAIENMAGSDEFSGDQNLINTVMQFRKVCNHPDLFERADIDSPFAFATFGKSSTITKVTALNSTMNSVSNLSNMSNPNVNSIGDGMNNNSNTYTNLVDVCYSTKNPITYNLPRLIYDDLLLPNYNNHIDTYNKIINHMFNIYKPTSAELVGMLSRLTGLNRGDFYNIHKQKIINRAIHQKHNKGRTYQFKDSLLIENKTTHLQKLASKTNDGILSSLLNIKKAVYEEQYLNTMQPAYRSNAEASPISIQVLGSNNFVNKINNELFDPLLSQAFSAIPNITQYNMHVKKHIPIEEFPPTELFPEPLNKNFSSEISMPSMDRFITESAKLKKLDELLPKMKMEGHRVLIYFQMTKMMDLMEEYLTYRQYNHIRLDGSSKLEDRRDLVHDWQTKPDIFIFLLSTRAGGLGINLTAADTVIFYDSDWNPTIDSQAMDRAHRLGQTRQVTVYRLLISGTIEERMRDRAKQKEQVQQVVMEGKTQENHVKTIDANAQISGNQS